MSKSLLVDFEAEELAEYFDYLDTLRESGVTNMYGAPAYLIEAYDLPRPEAVAITSAWMKTFSVDLPAEARAENALLAAREVQP